MTSLHVFLLVDNKVKDCQEKQIESKRLQGKKYSILKILPFIKENDKNVLLCQRPSFIFVLVT